MIVLEKRWRLIRLGASLEVVVKVEKELWLRSLTGDILVPVVAAAGAVLLLGKGGVEVLLGVFGGD